MFFEMPKRVGDPVDIGEGMQELTIPLNVWLSGILGSGRFNGHWDACGKDPPEGPPRKWSWGNP